MLVASLAILVVLFLSFEFGVLFKKLIAKLSFTTHAHQPSEFIYLILSGLMLIMVISSFISIFFRLNWEVLLGFVFISVVGFIVRRNGEQSLGVETLTYLKNNKLLFFSCFSIPLFFLIYNAAENPGSIGDTILYHAQCIQWGEKYKAIPGIANLHNRLAFNNQSLLLYSLFSFSFLGSGSLYVINSFLFLLLLLKLSIDLIGAVRSSLFGEIVFSSIIVIVSFYFFGVRIASPAPDTTAAILVIFSFLLFKDIYIRGFNLLPQLYLLVAALITVKISTLFVALLPLILFITKSKFKNIKDWLLPTIICIVAFTPFFIRNVILSGYLIYPIPIDLFSVDWKWQSLYRVNLLNEYITNAARITGGHKAGVWTIDMPFEEWFFEHWFTNTRKTIIPNIMLGFSLIFTLLIPIISKLIRRPNKRFYAYFFLYFAISTSFWFLKAPDYRFLWGNLTVVLAIIGLFLVESWGVKQRTMLLLPVFLMNLYLIHLGSSNIKLNTFTNNLIRPQTIESIEVEAFEFQGLMINMPKIKKFGGACFNAPIPCTHNIDKKLVARGDNITDGFKLK